MKRYCSICFLLGFSFLLKAQFETRLSAGVRLGGATSTILGLDETIYPEDIWNRDAFNFENRAKYGFVGGWFVNYKSDDIEALFAVHAELGFQMGGVKMEYSHDAANADTKRFASFVAP